MQRRWPEVYQHIAGRGTGAAALGGEWADGPARHIPIARETSVSWIIASFIKFSGTKLCEFLIENKLRRDSLIWISILRIKCGFMFSFRCFFLFVMQNNVPPCLGTTTRFIFEWKTLLKLSFPVKIILFSLYCSKNLPFESLMVVVTLRLRISVYHCWAAENLPILATYCAICNLR